VTRAGIYAVNNFKLRVRSLHKHKLTRDSREVARQYNFIKVKMCDTIGND